MAKDTKKRLIEAALLLFSQKGYEATSMADIAGAVGIRAPSMYDHFKSKQELFDAMTESMREYFWAVYPSLHSDGDSLASEARLIGENPELLKELAARSFRFYFADKYAGAFRRLLSIERFKRPEMDRVYRELYIDAPIVYQTALFNELTKQAYLRPDTAPRTAAIEAFSPVLYLISKYDTAPQRGDEAIAELERHVEQFVRLYFIKPGETK